MSDARWLDVDSDAASAVQHFASAVRIYREPGIQADNADGYMRRMAFMHAMFAGHTSLERALLRILDLHGEEAPSGQQWHADLIRRAGRSLGSRPPILPASLTKAADRTRRFRHVAAHTYDTFDAADADPAVRAAATLAAEFTNALAAYRGTLDP